MQRVVESILLSMIISTRGGRMRGGGGKLDGVGTPEKQYSKRCSDWLIVSRWMTATGLLLMIA